MYGREVAITAIEMGVGDALLVRALDRATRSQLDHGTTSIRKLARTGSRTPPHKSWTTRRASGPYPASTPPRPGNPSRKAEPTSTQPSRRPRRPTKQLPLTQALRDIGVPTKTTGKIDNALRPVIDAGYSRLTPNAGPRIENGKLVAGNRQGIRQQSRPGDRLREASAAWISARTSEPTPPSGSQGCGTPLREPESTPTGQRRTSGGSVTRGRRRAISMPTGRSLLERRCDLPLTLRADSKSLLCCGAGPVSRAQLPTATYLHVTGTLQLAHVGVTTR